MSINPDDKAWLAQIEEHAIGLKTALDSNAKIPSDVRLAAIRIVDTAVRIARYELTNRPLGVRAA